MFLIRFCTNVELFKRLKCGWPSRRSRTTVQRRKMKRTPSWQSSKSGSVRLIIQGRSNFADHVTLYCLFWASLLWLENYYESNVDATSNLPSAFPHDDVNPKRFREVRIGTVTQRNSIRQTNYLFYNRLHYDIYKFWIIRDQRGLNQRFTFTFVANRPSKLLWRYLDELSGLRLWSFWGFEFPGGSHTSTTYTHSRKTACYCLIGQNPCTRPDTICTFSIKYLFILLMVVYMR